MHTFRTRAFPALLAVAALLTLPNPVPAQPAPSAGAAADDVPRHAADAAGGIADAQPRRPVAALHRLHAGLEGGEAQTDIYLVSLAQGVPSTRQMTFTKDKNETSPAWVRDGRSFVFLSNREAPSTTASAEPALLDAS